MLKIIKSDIKNLKIIGMFFCFFFNITFSITSAEGITTYGVSIDGALYENSRSALRVSVFNITNQKFKEIHYYTFPSFHPSPYDFKDNIPPSPDKASLNLIQSIAIQHSAIINVSLDISMLSKNNYIIMSRFPVGVLKEYSADKCGDYIIYRRVEPENTFIPVVEIEKILIKKKYQGNENISLQIMHLDKSFEITTRKEVLSSNDIITPYITPYVESLYEKPRSKADKEDQKKKINNIINTEKGDLGEYATDLTMTSFGYKKYPSKTGERGLDGIYVSNFEKVIVFSDSKWGYKDSPETLLVRNLNDEAVVKHIIKIHKEKKLLTTLDLIKHYFENKEFSIYRLLYRIKDPGYANGCLKDFHPHQKSFMYESLISQGVISPPQPLLNKFITLQIKNEKEQN